MTVLNVSFCICDFLMTGTGWDNTTTQSQVQSALWQEQRAALGTRATGSTRGKSNGPQAGGEERLKKTDQDSKEEGTSVLVERAETITLWFYSSPEPGGETSHQHGRLEKVDWSILGVRSWDAICSGALWGTEEDFSPGMWAREFPTGNLQGQPDIEAC